ncbi:glycosyltransferase involved in cell wall biosynthesis [Paenibacillus anaericanus]|uniref:glycosyltransferase family 4 protein n=1 Tax=Paenibacillus anaericanus TaxID=170367 RepID=UPI002781C218|nr:glycosyltransferase family 4 protein [Paenibacillus anaericanus]MDQ0086848.1 glycosyltransferase involved in cell wall biosynthesis [Paenibacillus anaericanus]
MKILVVCSDFPYPADHGGRVDTWGRIKVLAELGWKIHLVVCGKQLPSHGDIEVVYHYVEKIKLCDRRSKLTDLLHSIPMQAQSRKELKHVNIDEDYNYVLLEGDYVYPILKNPLIKHANVILRVHNDEAIYFKALARSTKNIIHKLYYLMESYKFSTLQKKMLQKVDKYLFISNKEFEEFQRRHPSAKSLFLPPPVTKETFLASTFQTKHVVFIGSLFMPNNREAIEWYLEHVHPLMLQEPDYKFIVAGNSRKQSLNWLQSFDMTNVVVHDTPESLDDIYKSGYLFVNPMQNGAGVKLKTIEAIQNGLPVISTSIGYEGTGLVHNEHIMVADSPEEFYFRVKQMFDNPILAKDLLESSQQYIRTHYNHKEVLKSYINSLNTHVQLEQVL